MRVVLLLNTLSSNLEKLYERIVNERIKAKVNMTWAQAGGRQGVATTDHMLLMKEVVETSLRQKDTMYMVFLNVTKVFDKAWFKWVSICPVQLWHNRQALAAG